MEKVNAFDVIRKMSEEGNKKLRLAPLGNIIAVDQKGKRCTMTIGVEAEDVKNHMLDKIGYGGLLLIDKEAFEETEKRMAAEVPTLTNPWISTKEQLPKKPGKLNYEHVQCLATRGNGVEILMWNCEHLCWDGPDGDDYECDALTVTHWQPVPELPKTPKP